MLSDGHIPSQVGPRTEVQVAQSSFPNCGHRNGRVRTRSEEGRTGSGQLTDLGHADVLSPSSRSFEEQLLFSSSVHLQEFTCTHTHTHHHVPLAATRWRCFTQLFNILACFQQDVEQACSLPSLPSEPRLVAVHRKSPRPDGGLWSQPKRNVVSASMISIIGHE